MYYNPYNTYNMYNLQKQEITRVNGKNGAEAYPLAPNSEMLLLDTTAPIVWLKTTDGAGYATVTAYNIAPAQTAEQIEANKFDAIEKRISLLEEKISGNKSDAGTVKPE